MFTGLLGGIFGGSAKRDAGYAGAQLTDEQADNEGLVLKEQLRRKELEDTQILGSNTAAANASGFQGTTGGVRDQFQVTSTTQLYLQQMKSEQRSEREFMEAQGKRSISLMHQQADVQRQAADAGLIGDVLGGVNSAVSGFKDLSRGLGWIQ